MDQFQIYENFINLFSNDEEIRFNALLSKRDWILNRYYIAFNFASRGSEESYSDLECLNRQGLPFKHLNQPRLVNTSLANRIAKFNKKFKTIKLYDSLPERPNKDTFFVEVNFKKLDKSDYKTLVPNFFYCLNKSYLNIKQFLSNDIRSLLLPALIGNDNESVIVLDNKYLEKNIFKIDGMTKIYLYDDISEQMEDVIEKIVKYTNLKVVIVHA